MNTDFIVRKKGNRRRGKLTTTHGTVRTPAFMTIATRGAVKTLEASEVKKLGADIILSNTYHLFLRPGLEVLKKHKGLHNFMDWQGPILTDSGGYQIFSLTKLRTLTEDGATFKEPASGKTHTLTPEKVVDIQSVIGSDIMMVLDECPPYPASREYVERSMELTTRWAKRALAYKKKKRLTKQKLFAIVQGGTFIDLRARHAQELSRLDFDGFAIGGLAVGEPTQKMYASIESAIQHLPENKPRYLMGVGYPEQIVEAVKRGVDMFDCVLPTRNARHGNVFVWKKKTLGNNFYSTLNIKNEKFAKDLRPLDALCACSTCTTYTRSYLRHLFKTDEPLAAKLTTAHNVRFYQTLMERLRNR